MIWKFQVITLLFQCPKSFDKYSRIWNLKIPFVKRLKSNPQTKKYQTSEKFHVKFEVEKMEEKRKPSRVNTETRSFKKHQFFNIIA